MTDRLTRLRNRMADTGTDLVAIGPTAHMRWLLGLDPHGDERPVMLLVAEGYAGLLMPGLNAESARQATDLPFHCWSDEDGPAEALAGLLAACGVASGLHVAIDPAMRTDFALRLIDALPAHRRSLTDATVGALRMEKDADEIAILQRSARINDRAAMAGFAALREGMTELDVQAAIHAVYKAEGAVPAFTIVGFGANSAFPHHHTGATVLKRDMAVLIDTGCVLDGYPSDMTRCGWFGTPDPEFLKLAGIVEAAVQAALNASRAGVTAREIDHAARSVIAGAGYGDRFVHRTGHGLGVEIHEPPYITATSEAKIAKGNVFSIEPGIYLPGRFGVRLEDIVAITATGPEVLSGLGRALVMAS